MNENLTFAQWSFVTPFSFFCALVTSFTDEPVILLTAIFDETKNRRSSIYEIDVAILNLRRSSAIDEFALWSLARPVTSNVAFYHLWKRIFFLYTKISTRTKI